MDKRIGRFTSSEIFNLLKKDKAGTGFGKPALSYIAEKKYEKKLGRYLDNETNNKYCDWGKFIEQMAFDNLSIEYSLVSDQTIVHWLIDSWAGTPDLLKNDDTVCDIKCPFTLKSFCQLYECTDKESLISSHKDGEKYYWQLVSNAILTNRDKAELIVYCPYLEDLDNIRDQAGLAGIKWLEHASDDCLPWLDTDSAYNNIHIISFDISDDDKNLLTDAVLLASETLRKSKCIL